ncbi:MAG: YggT family protein [Candidatus Glassbacteria bacterium]|nr:YggT family protein [Candidatus Glassbacteria bacterium]
MMMLYNLLDKLLTFYGYLLLARIIISWFHVDHRQPWVRLLVRVTEPFLQPFRALIPPLGGMDFSPIVAFFVLSMIERLVLSLIGY